MRYGLINGMDYFHFFLHRRFQPWSKIEVVGVDKKENSITGEYEVTTTQGRAATFLKVLLGERKTSVVKQSLKVHFHYPHHLAELGEDIKVWAFFLPVNAKHVRVFITMYIRAKGIHRFLRRPFQILMSPLILKRIQRQDAWIGRQEQQAWEKYPEETRCEVNPISVAVEKLVRAKWDQHRQSAV